MKHIIVITLLIISVAAAATASPRVRGAGFHLLEDPVNPRSAAMGTAGTALGGSGFRYYNPVQPFFSPYSYAAAEFGQLPGGLNKGGFESALIFSHWFSAVNFYSSSVDFETRDERGFGSRATAATTIGAMAFGHIRDNFSIGVAATVIEDRIWFESNYGAFALSGGFGYKLLDGKLNVGAAGFHGVARSWGFGGGDISLWQHGDRVPRTARGGAAWTDTLMSIPYTAAADAVFSDEDGTVSVPVGLEVKILPMVDLRVGKRFGWETEIMSFGIGLNIDQISFDAAFTPSVYVDDHEMKWNMSLTYRLGGKRKSGKSMTFPPTHIKGDADIVDTVDTVDTVAVDTVVDTAGIADTTDAVDTIRADIETQDASGAKEESQDAAAESESGSEEVAVDDDADIVEEPAEEAVKESVDEEAGGEKQGESNE